MSQFLTPNEIPHQNIVIKLRRREVYMFRKPNKYVYDLRSFYQNIYPNFTIMCIDKPPCFLRKFSLDGKYFLAFSADQTSVEIYSYKGCAAAADLLLDCYGDYISVSTDTNEKSIRSKIFSQFFQLKHSIVVTSNSEQHLNRECSLFTDDKKYVIVGSAYVVEDLHSPFYHTSQNNEALQTYSRFPLEDYSLHIIDMENGVVTDNRSFESDKIYMSHNQGLYLYKTLLAVLSVQHQFIYIFKVMSGKFFHLRTIGRFCYDDDQFFLSSVLGKNTGNTWLVLPYLDKSINSLKHRFLVYLFFRALSICKETGSPYELRKFYQYFDHLLALRIWKMQILDEEHLLIKYASEEVVTMKTSEPNSQPLFFVVYSMKTTEIIAVYENTSKELLYLFENYCDFFRNSCLSSNMQFTSSPSNNIHAKLHQQHFKQTIISAKYGGPTEATKRLLAQLPISSQSYCTSPYLDLSLFSYDDKWVSMMERPKACGDHPIRETALLKFQIYPGMTTRAPPLSARRLVAFTFHPSDPFVISVQRTNSEYVVNIHVYHEQLSYY